MGLHANAGMSSKRFASPVFVKCKMHTELLYYRHKINNPESSRRRQPLTKSRSVFSDCRKLTSAFTDVALYRLEFRGCRSTKLICNYSARTYANDTPVYWVLHWEIHVQINQAHLKSDITQICWWYNRDLEFVLTSTYLALSSDQIRRNGRRTLLLYPYLPNWPKNVNVLCN